MAFPRPMRLFSPNVSNQMTSASILKTLCLGDSYTVGEGVRVGERWSTLWLNDLRNAGWVAPPSRVIARTGWTTDELAQQLDVCGPEHDYDLVTLMIGVNNQYRGRSIDEFQDQFTWLLEDAIASARATPQRCLTLSIPDWGVTPFAHDRDALQIAREIDAFNGVIADQTASAKACFVDVTSVSRLPPKHPEWFASDQLHPGPEMHRVWSEIISQAAQQQLALLSSEGNAT